jgi:hypothetical protein
VPQRAAGTRTDPPVSVPRAIGTIPPATAAPEPPEEPPQEVSGSHGLRTGPKCGFSEEKPKANSCMPVRPMTTAPAASMAARAGAVESATRR